MFKRKGTSDKRGTNELPDYYLEGQQIEAKLNRYKHRKEEVIKWLQFLSYQISNIEGKLKEIDTILDGDTRLEVTFIHVPHSFAIFSLDVDMELVEIRRYMDLYNTYVKNRDFTPAKGTLLDLLKMLTEWQHEKKARYYLSFEKIGKKAHTPMVIRERKRKKVE